MKTLMKYINTNRDTTASAFARTEPTFDGSVLIVSAQPVKANVSGSTVNMVKGHVRLTTPKSVEICDSVCAGSVNEMVEIRFNSVSGFDNIETLRAEVIRCMDVAIAKYSLAYGVIPPATADFDDA